MATVFNRPAPPAKTLPKPTKKLTHMDLDALENLKATIRKLPAADQDNLAGMLLMERLKRNKLVMPDIHKRIEDADPENWQTWEKTKEKLKNNPIDV